MKRPLPFAPDRILVIKLGALGDLVLCFRVFASIRAKFPKAKIALLTGPAFVDFAKSMPWFDEVLVDTRPSFARMGLWARLVRDVLRFAPDVVFDFQGKFRQSVLYALTGGPVGRFWSGAAPGCAAPRLWPPVPGMHYTDFIAAQLDRAGVPLADHVDLGWLDGDLSAFDLPARFALLIPGCSPTRLYKRWPPEKYAALAHHFARCGIASVMIGTGAEKDTLMAIKALAPDVRDLGGKTSLGQVAALARCAEWVIGNDTGPTHIAAAVGAKTIALIPTNLNPVWSCPKGPQSAWVGASPLQDLALADVVDVIGI